MSMTYKFSKELGVNECGYWSYVPIVSDSCGSYTTALYDTNIITGGCYDRVTTPNVCAEQPVRLTDTNGQRDEEVIRGTVIFVYVDCITLAPAPDEKQDPIWKIPGVPLSRGTSLMNAYQKVWKTTAQGPLAASQSFDASCNTDTTNATDCIDAMAALLDSGGSTVDTTGATKGAGKAVTVSLL